DKVGISRRNLQGISVVNYFLKLSHGGGIGAGSIADTEIGFFVKLIVQCHPRHEVREVPLGIFIAREEPVTVQVRDLVVQGGEYPYFIFVIAKTQTYFM